MVTARIYKARRGAPERGECVCAAVREFVPAAPGELPPEVAHSPMKPLGQEISHRVQMLVNLYPPQRVAWGAFVDLSKVVRPLRAKNHAKRLKYKDYKDIYYSED